jgi:hypothetical protein
MKKINNESFWDKKKRVDQVEIELVIALRL